MYVQPASSIFHQVLPVPAGTGTAMFQGRTKDGFLLSQNSRSAGIKVPVWRLLYFPQDQIGPVIYVRYHRNSGEVCACGELAVGSCGLYEEDKFVDIKDVCEGHLEEPMNV